MIIEIIKFFVYSITIVIISKFLLAPTIRKIAQILKLRPKTIGKISGYTTSMPELLTILASSTNGLIATSIYNIISSNIINLVQYLATIFYNKNFDKLKNKGIVINLMLTVITITVPIAQIVLDIELSKIAVPIFIFLFIIFNIIVNETYKLYLKKEEIQIEKEIKRERKLDIREKEKLSVYFLVLVSVVITLFVVGETLGDTLEILCVNFNIPQFIIGVLLGIITSIPELMTFFEAQRHYDKSSNKMLGVVEATNNLLTSNMVNLFLIQSIGMVLYFVL